MYSSTFKGINIQTEFWSTNYGKQLIWIIITLFTGLFILLLDGSFIKNTADDLRELIEDENINSPIILGHSMGGKAALLFAEKYPKYVDKLIVADIGLKAYPMHHDEILKGLNSVNLQEISSRNQAQQSIQVHIDNLGIQQFLLKNLYWIEKGKLAWRMNLKDIEKNIGEILVKINVHKNPNKQHLIINILDVKVATFFLKSLVKIV